MNKLVVVRVQQGDVTTADFANLQQQNKQGIIVSPIDYQTLQMNQDLWTVSESTIDLIKATASDKSYENINSFISTLTRLAFQAGPPIKRFQNANW
ncbi:unnamed protein product [Phytophthora lilii]|uniref:Unnamed protein product n=1 Tax=Phytophthora lilii TaxID=2077276 RepID=A0A9W6TBM4_9STRA|nr:unnamed protein product [Phytophthora lilii]